MLWMTDKAPASPAKQSRSVYNGHMRTLNIDGRPPDQPTEKELRFQVALMASIVTVLLSLICRYALRAPFVPEVLSDFMFAVLPISLVEAGVSLLGPFATELGMLACVVCYLLASTTCAAVFLRLTTNRPALGALISAMFAWTATMFLLLPVLGVGLLGANLRQGRAAASLWMLGIYGMFGLAVSFFSRRYLNLEQTAVVEGPNARPIHAERIR